VVSCSFESDIQIALDLTSRRFTAVVQDILAILKNVYGAHSVGIMPGSGTFGMEAAARQFAMAALAIQVMGVANLIAVGQARRYGEVPTCLWRPALLRKW
jgi:alanine-glyoxylate transaminase / serine-glyoxylate transaminase / serine-pyruvate transaminase